MNNSKIYQTKQKNVIKELFKNNPEKCFNAEQILSLLSTSNTNVSKATLYRTLDALVENKEVVKYNIDGSYACYQNCSCNKGDFSHIHFRCQSCGMLYHIENKKIQKLDKEISDEYGIIIDPSKTILYGTCKKCLGEIK